MQWLWLGFGLLAAFAMLSLTASERQRQLDTTSKPAANPAAAPESPAAPSGTPANPATPASPSRQAH
jgi:hypothetical protein